MKLFALTAAAVLLAGAASADPIFGVWKTEPGDSGNTAHVTIADCGGMICGTMGQAFDASGKAVASDKTGTKMIWDMKAKGKGKYSGGKILAPDTGKVYKSKLALNGNSLKVSGCVGPICKGQTWKRVK